MYIFLSLCKRVLCVADGKPQFFVERLPFSMHAVHDARAVHVVQIDDQRLLFTGQSR